MERLPMVDDLARLELARAYQTCRWRCGSQCFMEVANRSDNPTFSQVLEQAIGRRGFLAVLGGVLTALVTEAGLSGSSRQAAHAAADWGLSFDPVPLSTEDRVLVPPGYRHAVVIRWGDPVLPGAPAFDVRNQTARAQELQFGYNCDFVSFMPLPAGRRQSDRGLLVVNHEYTNPELMFPDYDADRPTREQVEVELAAHGLTVVEVYRRSDGSWGYVPGSPRNFRITARTPLQLTGPAAGHPLLRTAGDPSGVRVVGMLNNCAGGTTPWGTVLTCEENFHQYFAHLSRLPASDPRYSSHRRYGIPAGESERKWERFEPRFDVSRNPSEPLKFGWVVEVDPYDPSFVPRKRTALGRFKHEAATTVVGPDGRVAVYMGDDERFEYIYKFVTRQPFRPGDREHNLRLLDEGTLYVARFLPDGTGQWLPLVWGEGPLTEANGFRSQGDVVMHARLAADLVGATKMDRPEDVEWNPVNGRVYAVMTNNTQRALEQVDPSNPRPRNRHGHILELQEDGRDPSATRFTWQLFMLCGDPRNPDDRVYSAGFPVDRITAISCPDNIVFDRSGNLWIATDGQPGTLRRNDAVYVVPVEGPMRGYLRRFLSGPVGSEICGPEFTPDQRTFFCAIQHPGEGGRFEQPASTWPDGQAPPRPAVVAVWREGNGEPVVGL